MSASMADIQSATA